MTERPIAADWRAQLSVLLLFSAALPIKIYSVPGFEITPSLMLAPAALLLFRPNEKIHYAVVAFLVFCALLALVGITGSDGRLRNLIGAVSYSSSALYIFVGMTFGRNGVELSKVWRVISPIALAMTIIFAVDLYLTDGNILRSSSYWSISYSANETTYIQSFFPFYGKYAVITLATVAMVIGALSVGSADSFGGKALRIFVLVFSNALVFISFTMWTRQVMLGALIFYGLLIMFAFRRKETWISLAVFLVLLVSWSMLSGSSMRNGSWVTSAGVGNYKWTRSIHDLESGNFNSLSTGRLQIYENAVDRITPRLTIGGCGFCSLADVMKFRFATLHNVILTAVFKGGIIYATFYLAAAFFGLGLFWSAKKSFALAATFAAVVSIASQSLLNDVLYWQVIPALLFTLTGYLLVKIKRPANSVPALQSAPLSI